MRLESLTSLSSFRRQRCHRYFHQPFNTPLGRALAAFRDAIPKLLSRLALLFPWQRKVGHCFPAKLPPALSSLNDSDEVDGSRDRRRHLLRARGQARELRAARACSQICALPFWGRVDASAFPLQCAKMWVWRVSRCAEVCASTRGLFHRIVGAFYVY